MKDEIIITLPEDEAKAIIMEDQEQTTFNEDGLDVLCEDADIENENKEEGEEPEGIGAAFSIRTSKPGAGNRFYNNGNNGGESWCINGNPTDRACNVLANCVGYACGRFNEIIGAFKYKTLCCNAENFIERAKSAGLDVKPYPVLGGIMVWMKGSTLSGNDGAGHVAVVERIDSSNQIYTSESGWGGSAFWNSVRRNDNGRWGMGNGYTFRGCIVNPVIGDVHYNPEPKPAPSKSVDELAREVINGNWGNGQERKDRLTAAGYDYNAVQRRVNEILAGNTPAPAPKPSFDLLLAVRKTIRGDYGNGDARKAALGEHYAEVQHQVNLNVRDGHWNWDSIRLY